LSKITIKGVWNILKTTFQGFSDDKITKISGSLAYSTVFSMAPLLMVIIGLCSIFLQREAIEGKIYAELAGFMGSESALELQQIIRNASRSGKTTMATIIGGATLLIGATAVFAEIQDSINTIWGLKPKPKRGWLKMLQNRFLSFSIIVSLGFILLVSLGISTVIDGFGRQFQAIYPGVAVVVIYIINQIINLAVSSVIFAVIYKVLPDAHIRWRDVFAGAIVTALLFMAGKFAISLYISSSSIGSTFGAAGTLVVVLLWAYYSSMILYLGAEFTKAYAVAYGAPIHPNHYAVTTRQVEVEDPGATVQDTTDKNISVSNDNNNIELSEK
jgi:membrane protein